MAEITFQPEMTKCFKLVLRCIGVYTEIYRLIGQENAQEMEKLLQDNSDPDILSSWKIFKKYWKHILWHAFIVFVFPVTTAVFIIVFVLNGQVCMTGTTSTPLELSSPNPTPYEGLAPNAILPLVSTPDPTSPVISSPNPTPSLVSSLTRMTGTNPVKEAATPTTKNVNKPTTINPRVDSETPLINKLGEKCPQHSLPLLNEDFKIDYTNCKVMERKSFSNVGYKEETVTCPNCEFTAVTLELHKNTSQFLDAMEQADALNLSTRKLCEEPQDTQALLHLNLPKLKTLRIEKFLKKGVPLICSEFFNTISTWSMDNLETLYLHHTAIVNPSQEIFQKFFQKTFVNLKNFYFNQGIFGSTNTCQPFENIAAPKLEKVFLAFNYDKDPRHQVYVNNQIITLISSAPSLTDFNSDAFLTTQELGLTLRTLPITMKKLQLKVVLGVSESTLKLSKFSKFLELKYVLLVVSLEPEVSHNDPIIVDGFEDFEYMEGLNVEIMSQRNFNFSLVAKSLHLYPKNLTLSANAQSIKWSS